MNLLLNYLTKMKIFTKNFLLFIASAFAIITISRMLLSYFLSQQNFNGAWLTALVWGISLFISGRYFGKKDVEYLPLYQSGYRFHLATYLIFACVSFVWFKMEMNSLYEYISQLYQTLFWWGIFLIFHTILFATSLNKSIKGLEKSEIFE